MQSKTNKVISMIYTVLAIVLSLVSTIVCLFARYEAYEMLAILPISYLICYIFCIPNRRYFMNISIAFINLSSLVRYVILPMRFAIEGVAQSQYSNTVISLMVYEIIAVYIVIGFMAKRLEVPYQGTDFQNEKTANVFLILLIPICLAVYPNLISEFLISFDGNSESVTVIGVLYSFFKMGIWTLLVFMLCRLANASGRKGWRNNLGIFLAIIVSVYYILISCIDGIDVKRWQILSCGIAIIVVLIRIFPMRKKFILQLGTVSILISVIIGSFLKFGDQVAAETFFNEYMSADSLDVYFAGPKSIYDGLRMIESNPLSKTITSTFTDFFSGMPILSGLFDYDTYSTASMFQSHVGKDYLVCPLIVQSIAHFGYIGAPILTIIMTICGIEFNRAMKKTTSAYSAFVCAELCLYFSLFMELNLTIILGRMWIKFIFLILQKYSPNTKINFDK